MQLVSILMLAFAALSTAIPTENLVPRAGYLGPFSSASTCAATCRADKCGGCAVHKEFGGGYWCPCA